MVSNETRLETLKKQIAKRETLIKSESEKLKNDKKKLEQLETAVMSEYMTKEGISFDENFKKQLSLAKKNHGKQNNRTRHCRFFCFIRRRCIS